MKTGKVPENVLKRSVLRQIRAKSREEGLKGAGIGNDCAVFPFSGEGGLVCCMQEAVILPGEFVESGVVRRETFDGREAIRQEDRVECSSMAGAKAEGREVCESEAETKPENMAEHGSEAVPAQNAEAFMTIAELIQKCANNLAVGGAHPVAVMIALLLPEDTEERVLRGLMAQAAEKCRELDMEIVGGQSRITGAVTQPVAVVTGCGKPLKNKENNGKMLSGKAAPGQDVVLSKWIGLQGTAVLAKRNREKLLGRYPAYLVEEAAGFDRYLSVLPEAEIAVQNGACAMHDASEGGILGALWELAEGAGVGLAVDIRKLPLRQETVEVCECCNVNPYELMAGGCLIMTCNDGLRLAAALEAEGIPAAIVGKVTDRNERILVNGDEVRYMNRPERDVIYSAVPADVTVSEKYG